jgi:catechol 2,3-dioxygenase-like lactoylglutathione lyase family enzyme
MNSIRDVIIGYHTLVYSDDADATRAFFRDVLEWLSLDAGHGWLIFKSPPTEMGVHPTDPSGGHGAATVPHHQLSLMCDDIDATVAELKDKGVSFVGDVRDEGFGLVAYMDVPGAGTMQVYQPRHPKAIDLPG